GKVLAEVGWVWRWGRKGEQDFTFGPQGICVAKHRGYPLPVSGRAAAGGRFFLACDRRYSIDSQQNTRDNLNLRPVVFSFTVDGHAAPGFGETGIVHHDDIPAALQLHVGSGPGRVGKRRNWDTNGGSGTFELTVTTVGSAGNVVWRYGTTHGMQSAELKIFVPRTNTLEAATSIWVSAVVRWGYFLAIAGGSNLGGFVTVRYSDGSLLPPGTSSVVYNSTAFEYLEALPNGALEAFYRDPVDSRLRKRPLVMATGLMFDPNTPEAVVPSTSTLWINLPDGSTIKAAYQFDSTLKLLQIWLFRVRSDGSVDPAFGGGNSTTLPRGNTNYVSTTSFSRVDLIEIRGVLALKGGRYCLVAEVFSLPPLETTPQPAGLIAA